MENKTKKYIEVAKLPSRYECESINGILFGRIIYKESDIVELPDIAAMTDLEKLEWVLKDIGIYCHAYSTFNAKQKMETWLSIGDMETGYYDDKHLVFDKNGKHQK